MVLIQPMKNYTIYFILFTFILIFSCDENPFFIDCRDCTEEEPEYAILIVYLDNSLTGGSNPPATVKIYEGILEDNILLNTFYVRYKKLEIDVALNKKYTLTATYTGPNGKQYIAVDTAYPRVRYEKSQCENPCYYLYDYIVNLRIKYKA
ncbi:MAG: hypothetical protein ACUVTX_10055 [Bacteroidales bacterium]